MEDAGIAAGDLLFAAASAKLRRSSVVRVGHLISDLIKQAEQAAGAGRAG